MQLVMKNPSEMARTVLIVDDHEHLRQILALVLRYAGYETLEAGTGNQAVATAVSAQPSLILMDLDLPDMTGIDTAKIIKKNPNTAKIPIVACSASSGWEWREAALRAGMSDYLQKPIQTSVIKSVVDKFILPEN